MSYFGGSAPGPSSPKSPTASSERSVKSCYAVVYHLSPDRKWVVSGEGGWSEVHLCCDSLDNSHRLLAWTVKNQTVLLNANVTADCAYKEKSKNFHSFTDENQQRYGLGFHKSESGLRQAEHFVAAVVHVIKECKEALAEMEAYSIAPMSLPPPLPTAASATTVPAISSGGAGPPPLPPGASSGASTVGTASVASSTSPPPLPPAGHSTSPRTTTTKPPPPPAMSGGLPKYKPKTTTTASSTTTTTKPLTSSSTKPPSMVASGLTKTRSVTMGADEMLPSEHMTKGYTKEAPKGVPKLGALQIHPPKPGKMGTKHDDKISDVMGVERKVMVTYDKDKGEFAGLPPEWQKVLAKQFGVDPKHIPSTKLPEYPAKIPTVLITLKNALKDAGGYHVTGIFRLAPSADENDMVKDAIDSGSFDFAGAGVNVYANLIKVWFRDLPTPLLSVADPDQVECAEKEEQVVGIISKFPEPNKSIFLWLCDMCVEVAAFEEENKMGAKNLAIVIGPNLFDVTVFDNPMRAMTYSAKIVDFFEKAIVWRQSS